MSQLINTAISSAEILMATGVLREVGFDDEAEMFKASLFDRRLLPEAFQALEALVKNHRFDESRFATEAAFRTYQRLQKFCSV
ncbi:Uncharacterised protein [Pseudomonas luteola]|uniref:Uncharacterized protein n=1 Tax=Pseudomonas luteola TaxID=47886 RepID=A0A2X2C5H0_PSELU|nr:hypothetical protein [Pseudomonas luteola]SPZ02548.1 Uncharacterised protein [Pseudomonas luteola]